MLKMFFPLKIAWKLHDKKFLRARGARAPRAPLDALLGKYSPTDDVVVVLHSEPGDVSVTQPLVSVRLHRLPGVRAHRPALTHQPL